MMTNEQLRADRKKWKQAAKEWFNRCEEQLKTLTAEIEEKRQALYEARLRAEKAEAEANRLRIEMKTEQTKTRIAIRQRDTNIIRADEAEAALTAFDGDYDGDPLRQIDDVCTGPASADGHRWQCTRLVLDQAKTGPDSFRWIWKCDDIVIIRPLKECICPNERCARKIEIKMNG